MHKPERKPFPLPPQFISAWDEALSSPRDITLEAIETGQLRISNHLFLNFKHPNVQEFFGHEVQKQMEKANDRTL